MESFTNNCPDVVVCVCPIDKPPLTSTSVSFNSIAALLLDDLIVLPFTVISPSISTSELLNVIASAVDDLIVLPPTVISPKNFTSLVSVPSSIAL